LTDMKINASNREVRKFGVMFAIICGAVAAYSFYRHGSAWPWFLTGGALFAVGGLVFRSLLRPIYIGWMKFAFVLGWVNTRLILGVFFYGILTPVGLGMRLFGWDPLTRKIDRKAKTYWVERPEGTFDPKKYERLF
jgi:hypothetical protein